MTISEKAAYLKGYMDGLNLDTEKPEGKTARVIDPHHLESSEDAK